nr:hypothetical protein [Dubosiella newyorkensis]
MSISLLSGLIILVLLVIMLLMGVPIAIALGISSVCAILPIMPFDVAVLTASQRICLMVKFSPRMALISAMASVISSICSCKMRSCRSAERGIFSNWL